MHPSFYNSGRLDGKLYRDAKTNLEKWKSEGLKLYVYSSGSVYAQKLLFGNTEFGDLTGLFSGYFDTTTGQKKDAESYTKIAEKINLPPEEILFLSDIIQDPPLTPTVDSSNIQCGQNNRSP